jgi:hypothetical protein
MGRHVTRLWIENGGTGAIYYRAATEFAGTSAEGGELIPVEIPADYAAKRAAGTPYRLSIDDATGLPYWEAVPLVSDTAPSFAWLYMTTIDETGATVLMTDADGQPITTYAPVP